MATEASPIGNATSGEWEKQKHAKIQKPEWGVGSGEWGVAYKGKRYV